MLWRYPAKNRDKLGEVSTTIENDGHELRVILRGVEFRGNASNRGDISVTKLRRLAAKVMRGGGAMIARFVEAVDAGRMIEFEQPR